MRSAAVTTRTEWQSVYDT